MSEPTLKQYNEAIQNLRDQGKFKTADQLVRRRDLQFGATHTNQYPQQYNWKETAEAGARGLATGATLGFFPRISGAAAGAFDYIRGGDFSESYEQQRERVEEQLRQDRSKTGAPLTAAATDFIGGMATGTGLSSMALSKSPRLTADLTKNIGLGSGEGALTGLGYTESGEDPTQNILWGTGLGAAGGAASVPAGRGAGRLTGGRTNDWLADRRVTMDMAEAGMTPEEIRDYMMRPGVPDVMRPGDFMPRQTRNALQSSGEDTEASRRFMEERNLGTKDRVRDATMGALPVPAGVDPYDWNKQRIAQRKANASANYDPIRNEYVDHNKLAPWLDMEEIIDAFKYADDQLNPSTSRLSGEVGVPSKTVQHFLTAKKRYYQALNSETDERRRFDLRERWREIENEVETQVPALKEARRKYAEDYALEDAYALGSTTPFEYSQRNAGNELDKIKDQFNHWGESEREAYQIGLGKSMQNYINKNKDQSFNILGFAQNSDAMEFLKHVMPPDTWSIFETALDAEKKMQKAWGEVSRGPNTADKLIAKEEREAMNAAGRQVLLGIFQMGTVAGGLHGMGNVWNGMKIRRDILNDRIINNAEARAIMGEADRGMQGIERLYRQAQSNPVYNAMTADNLARGGTRQAMLEKDDEAALSGYLEDAGSMASDAYDDYVTPILEGDTP